MCSTWRRRSPCLAVQPPEFRRVPSQPQSNENRSVPAHQLRVATPGELRLAPASDPSLEIRLVQLSPAHAPPPPQAQPVSTTKAAARESETKASRFAPNPHPEALSTLAPRIVPSTHLAPHLAASQYLTTGFNCRRRLLEQREGRCSMTMHLARADQFYPSFCFVDFLAFDCEMCLGQGGGCRWEPEQPDGAKLAAGGPAGPCG